jgi:hypothetical protein
VRTCSSLSPAHARATFGYCRATVALGRMSAGLCAAPHRPV